MNEIRPLRRIRAEWVPLTRLTLCQWIAQLVAMIVSRVTVPSEWTAGVRAEQRRVRVKPTTRQTALWFAFRPVIQRI